MARVSADLRLQDRSARARLKVRQNPYWRMVCEGQHLGYYERRAHEEAAAADSAAGPAVGSAHRLLAIEYAAHAKALREAREPEAA